MNPRSAGSDLQTFAWSGAGDSAPAPDLVIAPRPNTACMLVPDPHRAEAITVLSHSTAGTLVSALISELGLGPGDTVLSLSEMLYVSPVTELWPILLAGGRLVIAPARLSDDGQQLSRLIRAEGVTFVHATPTRWEPCSRPDCVAPGVSVPSAAASRCRANSPTGCWSAVGSC